MAVLPINELKSKIDANIYQNSNQEITGGKLNTILNDVVDSLEAEDAVLNSAIADVEDLASRNRSNIGAFPIFSASATYAVGDIVNYEDMFYKFVNAHSGEWADADVEAYSLKEYTDAELTELEQEVANIQPIIVEGDVINLPDNIDITNTSDNKLQFKDRTTTDGMGYIIMRKNKTFAEQLTQSNTIYEIRYDFDLDGADVTIPSNCVLNFVGGSLKNGNVIFSNTLIIAEDLMVFDIKASGTIKNQTIKGVWFDFSKDSTNRFKSFMTLQKANKTFLFDRSVQIVINDKSNIGSRITADGVTIKNLNVLMEFCNPLFEIGKDNENPTHNITIENCIFDSTDYARQTIALRAVDNMVIRGNTFNNIGYSIIQFQGYSSNNVVVEYNIATNCNLDFIECNSTESGQSKNWIIRGNIYKGDVAYGTGIYDREHRFIGLTAVDNVLIEGNFAEKSAGDALVHIEGTQKNVVIRNNIFENAVGYFVWLVSDLVEDVIIDSNIFRITDIKCCGIGGYSGSTNTPYFISTHSDKYRKKPISITNNLFFGYVDNNKYYGQIDAPYGAFSDNRFESIYGITAMSGMSIRNNTFNNCYNCLSIQGSSSTIDYLEYYNNKDVNTKEYSIILTTNVNIEATINEPKIINNEISGKVLIGQTTNLIFNYNTINNDFKEVTINKTGSASSTILSNLGNKYNNIIFNNILYDTDLLKGLSKDSEDLMFYNNDLWFTKGNLVRKPTYAMPVVSERPNILCSGLPIFNTSTNRLEICKKTNELQYWNVTIEGTATTNGYITFTQDNGNINDSIPINIGDTSTDIIKRIRTYGIFAAFTSNEGSTSFYCWSITSGPVGNLTVNSTAEGIQVGCVKYGNGVDPLWVDVNGKSSTFKYYGNTANRPKSITNGGELLESEVGFRYFDTTLNKPIWWTGSKWVDAEGKELNFLTQGTTAQRPTGVNDGFEYYDTDLDMPIYWDTRTQRWLGADGFTAGFHKGADDARPTLTMYDQGYTYWDVFLNKLIVWNGSAWVDSNGTEL